MMMNRNANNSSLAIFGDVLQIPQRKVKWAREVTEAKVDDLGDSPELEPEVLARLEDYRRNPRTLLVCTDCVCTENVHVISKRLARLYDSEESSSSDDEDDLTLDVILNMLHKYEKRLDNKCSSKALLTLIKGYRGHECMTESHVTQILHFLHCSNPQLCEASTILLRHLCSNVSTSHALLEKGLLGDLITLLNDDQHHARHPAILHVMEEIIFHKELQDGWLELALSDLVPLIMREIDYRPMEMKVAACCIIRALARHRDLAGIVRQEILPYLGDVKDHSARLKEIYAEILTCLVINTENMTSDLLPNLDVIPVALDTMCKGPCGPQSQALCLISALTLCNSGLTAIVNSNVLPYVVSANRDSKCRRVCQIAAKTIRDIMATSKPNLAKELTLQLYSFLYEVADDRLSMENGKPAEDEQKILYPVRAKHQAELKQQKGLEGFTHLVTDLFCKEAKIARDNLGKEPCCSHSPGVDTSPDHVTLMSNLIGVLRNICMWPGNKSNVCIPGKADLSALTDNQQLRSVLSRVNVEATYMVWLACGESLLELLHTYTDKVNLLFLSDISALSLTSLSNDRQSNNGTPSSSRSTRAPSYTLADNFDDSELELLENLLEIMITFAFCTCTKFNNFGDRRLEKYASHSIKTDDNVHNKVSKKSSTTKGKLQPSASVNNKAGTVIFNVPNVEANTNQNNIYEQIRAKNRVKTLPREPEKLWDPTNPHLTHSINRYASPLQMVENAQEQEEPVFDQKYYRKQLCETGIILAVGPFVAAEEESIKILALLALRCCSQQLDEKMLFAGNISSSKRPQSAGAAYDRQKMMNAALNDMDPKVLKLLQDASDPYTIGPHIVPNLKGGNTTTEKETQTNCEKVCHRISLDPFLPIGLQCHLLVLSTCGSHLVAGMFTRSRRVKKHCLLLIQDLVYQGDIAVIMMLSELNIVSKMLDFLRVNDDDELLEITGLIITRMLVNSDPRLKQLFHRHGGPSLLMTMSRSTSGALKEEVKTTMKAMTNQGRQVRPSSALSSQKRASDVWDYIQRRWKQEDRVVKLLAGWIQH